MMKRNYPSVWLPVLLCLLALAVSGCRGLDRALGPDTPEVRPDRNPPPLDAYALSGGKITGYTPTPGRPNDPAAEALLTACRQIKVDSHTARSAFVVITTGQYGKFDLSALVVGNKVLVLPGDLVTMGIGGGMLKHIPHSDVTQLDFYEDSPTQISLLTGSRWAVVGQTRVPLTMHMVEVPTSKQLVTTLPDLLRVFGERDRQRRQSPFIRSARIIYNLRDE